MADSNRCQGQCHVGGSQELFSFIIVSKASFSNGYQVVLNNLEFCSFSRLQTTGRSCEEYFP